MLQEFNDSQKEKPEAERQYISDGKDLYQYYLNQNEEFDDSRILLKDLSRTRPKFEPYKVKTEDGKNPLYNILHAYAQFDLEIGYCQGMNYFVDLFWQHLKNEEESFFCLVHIMKVHDWRQCFNMEMSKLKELLEFLEQVLMGAWPKVYDHIIEEIEISLVPIFSPIL